MASLKGDYLSVLRRCKNIFVVVQDRGLEWHLESCKARKHWTIFDVFSKAVANASVPVTADVNIKVLVNLKLQPGRHADTLIFTLIHLMYLMIIFLCRKLKNIIVSENFFQTWHLFIFYRYCNYKQIRCRYTGSAFLELKVPVLELRT